MYCCVPGCGKRTQTLPCQTAATRVSFHKLPSDPKLLREFILRIRRDKDPRFKINHHTRICSQHYTPEDYYSITAAKRELRPGALPSIFNFNGSMSNNDSRKKKKNPSERKFKGNNPCQMGTSGKRFQGTLDFHIKVEPSCEDTEILREAADCDAPHGVEGVISTEDFMENIEAFVKKEDVPVSLDSRASLAIEADSVVRAHSTESHVDEDGIEFVALAAEVHKDSAEESVVVKQEEVSSEYTLFAPEEYSNNEISPKFSPGILDPLSQDRPIKPELGTYPGQKFYIKGIRKKPQVYSSAPLQCKVCGETFSRKDASWRSHQKIHYNQRERLHTCKICGKLFHSNYILMRHEQAHIKHFSDAMSEGRVVGLGDVDVPRKTNPSSKKSVKKFKILVPVELLSKLQPHR